MNGHRISIGSIAIDGLAHTPRPEVLRAQLSRAIEMTLAARTLQPAGAHRHIANLQVNLPCAASAPDVAHAIAAAIAHQLEMKR